MEIKRELYFDEENKNVKIRYYVPTKNFLSFVLPTNEKMIDWSYNTKTEEYIIYCEENSSNNFLSEIRALTKEHQQLPFSQKYKQLAQTIREAARRGESSCSYVLSSDEIDALRTEGFTVQQAVYYNSHSTISW